MIILLAVLALVVVQALAESPWGVFTIAMTIPIALLMGLALRRGAGLAGVTLFGVAGLALSVWGGAIPARLAGSRTLAAARPEDAVLGLILYGFAASALPVWLLLAPRDYLSTFMKLGAVAALAGGRGPDPSRR